MVEVGLDGSMLSMGRILAGALRGTAMAATPLGAKLGGLRPWTLRWGPAFS
jgi:hypothetical protein